MTFPSVSWPLQRKLVESMEYTDARFVQQSVTPIEGCDWHLLAYIAEDTI